MKVIWAQTPVNFCSGIWHRTSLVAKPVGDVAAELAYRVTALCGLFGRVSVDLGRAEGERRCSDGANEVYR